MRKELRDKIFNYLETSCVITELLAVIFAGVAISQRVAGVDYLPSTLIALALAVVSGASFASAVRIGCNKVKK